MPKYIVDANLPYYFSLWADFSHWVLFNNPPPRVIHIRLGNMKIKTLHQTLANIWDNVLQMSENHKLIRIYSDAIEAID